MAIPLVKVLSSRLEALTFDAENVLPHRHLTRPHGSKIDTEKSGGNFRPWEDKGRRIKLRDFSTATLSAGNTFRRWILTFLSRLHIFISSVTCIHVAFPLKEPCFSSVVPAPVFREGPVSAQETQRMGW